MKRFLFYVAIAVLAVLPGLMERVGLLHLGPVGVMLLSGAALLGAGFMLSWGAEAAERHVSQGLAVAGLALVTILPEYVVDIYYSYQAGQHPNSDYVGFAAANMTGANRLLVGFAWPLIVLLSLWRSRESGVTLRRDNSVEIVFLAIASLYAFVIDAKGRIDLFDTLVLVGLYAVYLRRVGKMTHKEEQEEEVGPSAALNSLPVSRQWAAIAALTMFAAIVILAVAEPFAESMVSAGGTLGINKFLLIQWIAPLASEAPGVIITILFVMSHKSATALRALISDKINQWTLLVGMIPLFFSLGAGRLSSLPLDARQHEEFFLTAAQSLFALSLLLGLRLSVRGALALLALFLAQVGVAYAFQHDEPRTIQMLTGLAWVYIALAFVVVVWNRSRLLDLFKAGLWQGAPSQTAPAD